MNRNVIWFDMVTGTHTILEIESYWVAENSRWLHTLLIITDKEIKYWSPVWHDTLKLPILSALAHSSSPWALAYSLCPLISTCFFTPLFFIILSLEHSPHILTVDVPPPPTCPVSGLRGNGEETSCLWIFSLADGTIVYLWIWSHFVT